MLNRRTMIKGTVFFATSFLSCLSIPSSAQAAPQRIKIRDLYNKDLSFSDLAKDNEGKVIAIDGFMAPPLKAESNFFVLTKMPLSVCPFCETEAEWPDDILAIYTKRILDIMPFNKRIIVRGTLQLGGYTDPETGFVSRVRLENSRYERV